MDRQRLTELLEGVRDGDIAIDSALERLAVLPYESIDGARVDHHRALRRGFPEVVYGGGKTPEQIVAIMQALLSQSPRAVASRVTLDAADAVLETIPDAVYHADARMIVVDRQPIPPVDGVSIVSAGTSDLPVAAEAVVTAEVMGNRVQHLDDIGVAGLHRLLAVVPQLRTARVIVVVAGMDGALPSVVAGLVSVPVIAVPTSIGYGANFGGVSALLTMLNSCSAGISVVNIDNGFGAGVIAAMINRRD